MVWTERLREWVPGWAFRAKRRHWLALFTTLGGVVDGLLELVHQGALATMPGQTEDPRSAVVFSDGGALAMLGRERLVRRGLDEDVPSYSAALRRFREALAGSGSVPELLEQLARVLGPNTPRLRIVNAHGVWWTREPDGTLFQNTPAGSGLRFDPDGTISQLTVPSVAWDWDSLTEPLPPDAGDPARFWLIVYPPASAAHLVATDGQFADPGVCGDGWNDPTHGGYEGTPDAGTIGTNAPTELVELVRGVLHEWRAAGFVCAYVIVAFDPLSFAPDGSSAALYPNGRWGYASACVLIGGVQRQLPSREPSAEYWPAAPGGRAP